MTEETLEGILEMAEFLGIEDIINCWKIRAVALAQDNNSIIEAADTYITKNFSKLITSQSFLDLSYLQVCDLSFKKLSDETIIEVDAFLHIDIALFGRINQNRDTLQGFVFRNSDMGRT